MCPREFQPAGLEAVSCGYWASGALSLSRYWVTHCFLSGEEAAEGGSRWMMASPRPK